MSKVLLENLVTHLLTQEFGDHGVWGGNRTDAIYLLASLSPVAQKEFVDVYLTKFRERLLAELPNLRVSASEYQQLATAFADFNPTFSGRFTVEP